MGCTTELNCLQVWIKSLYQLFPVYFYVQLLQLHFKKFGNLEGSFEVH